MPVLVQDALADSVARTNQVLLQLGRDMLAFKRSEQCREFGCNNVRQYAEVKHDWPETETGALVRVAEALESLPALAREAEEGRISWHALRLLVPYATPESDEVCVRLAQEYSVGALTQVVRDMAACMNGRKKRDRIVHWKLDGQTQVMVEHALRKLSERSGRRLNINDGLQQMSTLVLEGSCDEAAVERQRQHADKDILADEARRRATLEDLPEELTDEIPEVRLVKVADLKPWENRLLHFNPDARGLTEAQRTELLRRDGYCCASPGCHSTLWLEAHHVIFWYQGGRTLPHNLVILCSACHKLIHEGLLVLAGVAPDGLEFRDRWGRPLRIRAPSRAGPVVPFCRN